MKNSAFTLAEILITLGIIGVVASMTMPTLVANIQDKVLETQQAKAKSILANGYKSMLAQNEVFELTNTPLAACTNSDCVNTEHLKAFKAVKSGIGLANLNMPEKYLDKSGNEFTMDWSNKYVFITPDGYVYALDVDKLFNEGIYNVYTDVNAAKNPSKEKKDLMLYSISANCVVTEVDIDNPQCSRDNIGACNEEQCNALGSSFDPISGCTKTYWWTGGMCTDDIIIQCG